MRFRQVKKRESFSENLKTNRMIKDLPVNNLNYSLVLNYILTRNRFMGDN